ncbi:MAG: hypothetical protein ACRD3M_04190 [Thermoanaerobaculia bacterium]
MKEGGMEVMRFYRRLALAAALAAAPALAQEKPAEQAAEKPADRPASNMQILREKVRADRKLLVAENLELTESEAAAFWPVYDAYQKDLQAINERLGKVIVAYAEGYNKNTLTDEQAKKLTGDVLAIEASEVKLRKSYADKLAKVLPGKKTARYLQIESKIRALVRYELATGIPLVE